MQTLASKGTTVYALDLRGSARSTRPSYFRPKLWNWTLDDLVDQEIRTTIDWMVERHAGKKIHWIGHSMGGIAYFLWLCRHGSEKILSGTTVGSSIDYFKTGSHYESLLRFKALLEIIKIWPIGLLYHYGAPLISKTDTEIKRFLTYPSQMTSDEVKKLLKLNFSSVPATLLSQLSTAFENGGLKSSDHKSYAQKLQTRSPTPPTFLIAGDEDLQCPPTAVEKSFHLLRHSKNQLKIYGMGYGHQAHYGHFDFLCGKFSKKEVWPDIVKWIHSCESASQTLDYPGRAPNNSVPIRTQSEP